MNRPLKLMQVLGAGAAGGAENYFIRYIVEMQEHADILPVVKKGSWAAERLTELEIPFETLPFKNNIFNFFTKRRFKKLVKAWQPDVVQTWMNRASAAIPSGLKVPVVARLGGYYKLKNYKRATWLAGVTKDIQDYVIGEGWPAERTTHMPNFYPIPPASTPEKRQKYRQKFKLTKEDKVVLYVGRLHRVKGVDLLLRALPGLHKNTHLIIVGEGPERQNLETLAAELNVADFVHFWGWEVDVTKPAAAADIWVFPSRHEPFGSITLEAWGNKVPLVTTASEGPAATVTPNENCLMVPLEDVEALKQAILTFQENPKLATKMAENGFDYFNKHFTARVLVPEYLTFYKQVLETWRAETGQPHQSANQSGKI